MPCIQRIYHAQQQEAEAQRHIKAAIDCLADAAKTFALLRDHARRRHLLQKRDALKPFVVIEDTPPTQE